MATVPQRVGPPQAQRYGPVPKHPSPLFLQPPRETGTLGPYGPENPTANGEAQCVPAPPPYGQSPIIFPGSLRDPAPPLRTYGRSSEARALQQKEGRLG